MTQVRGTAGEDVINLRPSQISVRRCDLVRTLRLNIPDERELQWLPQGVFTGAARVQSRPAEVLPIVAHFAVR